MPHPARSFEAQLDEAMGRAYVAAWRWLGNHETAREACQEAAARALAAKDRYDPSMPFYPWFYTILKNHCRDRLAQPNALELSDQDGNSGEWLEAHGPSAEDRLLQSERERAVATAITRLPPDLREIIELRHFQDLSYEELAATLEAPPGTVMSRLYRARKELCRLLSEEMRPAPERRTR